MEKRELLRRMDIARGYFETMRGTYYTIIEDRNWLERLYKTPKKALKKGNVWVLVLCTLIAFFILNSFFPSLVSSMRQDGYSEWPEDLGKTLSVITFWVLTAFVVFMAIYWRRGYKKAVANHKNSIEQSKHRVEYGTQSLINYYAAFEQRNGFECPVSIKYSYPDTISLFMGYIDEGRADNVKEAINLSISEMRYEQEVMQRNRMYSAVQNVNANARRAAVFSGIAAAASIFGALSGSD